MVETTIASLQSSHMLAPHVPDVGDPYNPVAYPSIWYTMIPSEIQVVVGDVSGHVQLNPLPTKGTHVGLVGVPR